MNQDLEILIEELQSIRDNSHGNLKENSTIHLSHSEIISFVRSCIKAIQIDTINPFYGWNSKQKNQIRFFLNIISTNGLCHRDRSRAAQRCLNIIHEFIEEEAKKKQLTQVTQNSENDEGWHEIPF